jgi:hypothetical protein
LAPSSFNQATSQEPLKPVCPVTKTVVPSNEFANKPFNPAIKISNYQYICKYASNFERE